MAIRDHGDPGDAPSTSPPLLPPANPSRRSAAEEARTIAAATGHGPALAALARAFGGYPDTEAAVCTGVDRYGLDLRVHTPRGVAHTRVGFPAPLDSAAQLRPATAELMCHAESAISSTFASTPWAGSPGASGNA